MSNPRDLADEALVLLRRLTGDPASGFRADQLEAILALAGERGRVLLVQRTGWGKSAVYFIATRLLRDRGLGPTLLVSPLLALMRNQIEAAERLGVRALTINSSNREEWGDVTARIEADEVDVLLISPERLANQQFRNEVLPVIGRRSGCSSSTRPTASPTGATTSAPTTGGWSGCWTCFPPGCRCCAARPPPTTGWWPT